MPAPFLLLPPFNGALHLLHPTEIEGSLTSQLSTLIQKNGFLCQKIETLQRNNTDLEYKFSITNSELERARREYSELHAKYELRSANYKDLKDVCYQLDAQLNKKNGVASEESFLSRIELNSDRKKRRMSVDIADDDSDSGGGGNGAGVYAQYEETAPAEGSMVAPNSRAMMPLPVAAAAVAAQRALSPPTVGPTQSTWTCLWKNCNQVFNALDWLVGHVEEFHIGLGKVRFSFTPLLRVTSENKHTRAHTTPTHTDIRSDPFLRLIVSHINHPHPFLLFQLVTIYLRVGELRREAKTLPQAPPGDPPHENSHRRETLCLHYGRLWQEVCSLRLAPRTLPQT